MYLEPGIYFLQNIESGSVLDLSGWDKRSVIGFSKHGWKNQKWELGKLGNRGWFIRNLYTTSSHYLTVDAGLGQNIPVVATEFPVAWDIIDMHHQEHNVVYSICWPNSQLAVGLHQENSADSIPVKLLTRSWAPQQHWKLVRCSDDDASTTLIQGDDARTTTTTVTTTTTTTTKVVTNKNGMTPNVEQ